MSANINKILFTTDLTEHARHAYEFASSLADRYGASIATLHVIEELPGLAKGIVYSGMLNRKKWELIKKQKEDKIREILVGKNRKKVIIRQVRKSYANGEKIDNPDLGDVADEIFIKEGNIADEIVKQAKISDVDLIIMAYYARNMVAESVMRSVTRKVLRRSKKPVLLVPMPGKK